MELKNKVALVTGAGVRLGQEIAKHLAQLDMQVAVHYHRSEEGAKTTLAQLKSKETSHALFSADLCDVSQVELLVDRVEKQMGPVSVLINNAAAFYPTPLFSVEEAQWDHFFDLNLKAPFFLAQRVAESMTTQGEGKIINIADTRTTRPRKKFIPYTITKAGLITLTHGLARALAPEIQVNAIAPGTVLPIHEEGHIETETSIQQSLLKRIGSPQDVVAAVDYLLHGDFLTGVVLPVDGGRSLV